MDRDFTFTPEAENDLLQIWEYIATDDSPEAADRVIARIYDECQALSEMPGKGHARLELLDERHRFWSVWSYLLAYRWQTKPLQIIAVVHGARELDAFFSSRPA